MKKYNICFVCKKRKIKDVKVCQTCLTFLKFSQDLATSIQILSDLKKVNKRVRIIIEADKRDGAEKMYDRLSPTEFSNIIFK